MHACQCARSLGRSQFPLHQAKLQHQLLRPQIGTEREAPHGQTLLTSQQFHRGHTRMIVQHKRLASVQVNGLKCSR
jgi:hypothetical protein